MWFTNRKNLGFAVVGVVFSSTVLINAAHANPSAPQVTNGSATFTSPDINTLNITNSDGAIINWQSFSIDAGQTTRFIQNSPSSSVLNRDVGGSMSVLSGSLLSNGRVFLINTNGIFFGAGAIINVNRLVASTLDITNQDFINKNYIFNETGGGASIVFSDGSQITADTGGQVWVMAKSITGGGANVSAPSGKIAFAAGSQVALTGTELGNMSFILDSVTTSTGNDIDVEVVASSGTAEFWADQITLQSGSTLTADIGINVVAGTPVTPGPAIPGAGGCISIAGAGCGLLPAPIGTINLGAGGGSSVVVPKDLTRLNVVTPELSKALGAITTAISPAGGLVISSTGGALTLSSSTGTNPLTISLAKTE